MLKKKDIMMLSLSERTLDIIKNFSKISPGMMFREGNVLRIMNKTYDVCASATVPEFFPREFVIANLSRFLGAISLFEKPSLVFNEKTVSIVEGDRKIDYVLSVVTHTFLVPPDRDPLLPPTLFSFDLSKNKFKEIIKAVGLLDLPEVVLVGDGSKISVQVINSKNQTSDAYVSMVGETDRDFRIYLSDTKMQSIVPDDYKVTVTYGTVRDTLTSCIWFQSKDINYYITPEHNSSEYGD